MYRYIIVIAAILSGSALIAQERVTDLSEIAMLQIDSLSDSYLDSLKINKKIVINDYSMVGVQYGAGLSQVMWNPSKKQEMLFVPLNIGVTYTRYGKMFGYMPYFGFQAGLFYAQEGYQLKKVKSDYESIEGADKAVLDVLELPVLAHCHIDFWKMTIIVNLGCYAGYRLAIKRFPYKDDQSEAFMESFRKYQNSFTPTDRRWDYGIKGGIGFGFVFDPIEIHLQAMYKHSLSSLYDPDYYSKEYYRFAYPANIVISAGIHFQITKRTGKTKASLKKTAKEMVYGPDKN